MRVAPLVVVLVAIAAACGGAAETNLLGEVPDGAASSGASSGASSSGASGSGSSGASGNVSSSGDISSSGVVPIDAGADTGPAPGSTCNVNAKDACLPTDYCKVEACNQIGVCSPRPTAQGLELNPVCGCDHVTYWNQSIAGIHGVNIAATGACGVTGTACTKNAGCAGDAKCNLEQGACQVAGEPKGTCWQLPKSCEGTSSRTVRRCNNAQCTSLCAAIDDGRQFVAGVGCL